MPMPLPVVKPPPVFLFGSPTDLGRTFKIVVLAEGFTKAELATGSFAKFARSCADNLIKASPFRLLREKIAIVRIDSESQRSSTVLTQLQPPPTGYLTATPFSSVWSPEIGREIISKAAAVKAYVALYPELVSAQALLVIVNHPAHGGCASDGVATLTTEDGGEDTFIHELGHSAFGLRDEYSVLTGLDNETPREFSGGEPVAPNVTTHGGPNVVPPWFDIVTPGVPLPSTEPHFGTGCKLDHKLLFGVPDGAVGAFEGGGTFACGLFRPIFDCRMRESANDFCPVCDRTGFSRIGGLIQAGRPTKIVTIGLWTHVISLPPFTTLFGRVDHHLFTYRASTGELGLLPSFRLSSTSTDPALNQFADAFFSTLCCFEVNGTSYLLFTDSATLHRAIHRVSFDPKGNPSATFFNKAFEANISIERGYTHAVPCTLAGVTHVVSYDRFTGDVLLERMDQVNGLDISPQVVASTRLGTAAPFKTGWTGLAVTEVGGEQLIVGTAADSGIAWVGALQLPAGGPPPLIAVDRFLSPRGFLKGVHTHLTAIAPHGQPMLFAYSPIDGYGYFYRPRPRGTGIDFQRSTALGLGGQMIFGSGAPALGSLVTNQRPTASPLDETTLYWFYNAATGKIRLGEFA